MQNSISSQINDKVRLILVDDHKLFRCGIKSLFENSKGVCVIAEASNGKEGISKIIAQNPDVVLLDLELGDINGLDLIEKVLAQKPNVKFIILTSHINEHVINKAMKMGIYGYILKFMGDAMPFVDAFTTVSSVAAMIVSVKMFAEQWWIWVAVDVFTIYMWYVDFMNGSDNIATLLMWIVYLGNAVIMLVKWERESRMNERKEIFTNEI